MCLLSPAGHHSNLLFFTSVLALLAPLLALEIENLERLKASLDDITNLPSDELHPGMCFLSYIPKLCSSKPQVPSPPCTEREMWKIMLRKGSLTQK